MNTIQIMGERVRNALASTEIYNTVKVDFKDTFLCIGLSVEESTTLTEKVLTLLGQDKDLRDIEAEINTIFTEISIRQVLNDKVSKRSDVIYGQIQRYLGDIKGEIVDYGTGDGKIAQLIHDKNGLNIEGYDVVIYPAKGVTVPMHTYDGKHIPVENNRFDAGLLINVIHHEAQNERILEEISRIVRRKLIIIETVPVGKSESELKIDHERTFMNDYLYNRLFHYGDNVPVPGTYETPKGWEDRLSRYGWKVVESINLGVDQEVIKDTHHLLILVK